MSDSEITITPRTGDHIMKISPLELRQRRFRTVFRGFDRAEVLALLTEVADDYEYAFREIDHLRQDLSKMEALLSEHRDHERNLRDTLLTAQKLSSDIQASAESQARQTVREAEGRADLLLERTQARLADMQRDIDGLRLKRHEATTSLEATIASLQHAIEFVREQEQKEREDRILLHRPRQPDAHAASSRTKESAES